MKILNYNIKNKVLAIVGLLFFLSTIFVPDEYGLVTRIFFAITGVILIGISTGNKKFISEIKALVIIVIIALSVKVTLLEAYIVPTGSMEKTIMTGDFLIGSRFVYGMRTPDWIGIPYTDIGVFIPNIKLPEFKEPAVGDVLIFNYPRDKYVKYVKRCIAGPGDTLLIENKQVYINGVFSVLPEHYVFSQPEIPKTMQQKEIYLSSENNINKDNMGPVIIPKRGDYFKINENTNWRKLLPIMLMEGHTAKLERKNISFEFTLQDPHELYRRKEKASVFDPYFVGGKNGDLITPWSRSIRDQNFKYLIIDGAPISDWEGYEVKQNYYWAMGDNRDDSLDSRYWGLIPENFILGEALFAYFSLDLRTWIPRFERIGTIIR